MSEVKINFDQAFINGLAEVVAARVRDLLTNGSAPAQTANASAVSNGQPNDPWATTPGVPTDQTHVVPSAPVAPPYAAPNVPAAPAPVAPPMATQQPQAAQTGTITINAPSGPQTWTLDAPNAPSCNCNPAARAAYVKGTTAKGRPYAAWRCAKAAGKDWKAKCDYNVWA